MSVASVLLFLKIGIAILFILFFTTLNKGLQLAHDYKQKGKKKSGGKKGDSNKFTEESIRKAARMYNEKGGYALSFDTNVLIEHPNLLEQLRNELDIPIYISQQVRYELDFQKDKNPETTHQARIALKHIADMQKRGQIVVADINKAFIKEQGLRTDVNDDLIIGSYLEEITERQQIVFITDDKNARTTARMSKLIALESDWDKKGLSKTTTAAKISKAKEFRPGYAFKVLSIIFLSLAVGFIGGHVHLSDSKVSADEVQSTDGKLFLKKNKPTYIEGNYPYVVKSEYGDIYQGKKAGDWGAIALVDTEYSEFDSTYGYYKLRIASWLYGKAEDKENQLEYVLVTESGKKYPSKFRTHSRMYMKDNRIEFVSKEMNVNFEGINSYDEVSVTIKPAEFEKVGKGTLHLVHKMTGELVQKIPLSVLKKTGE